MKPSRRAWRNYHVDVNLADEWLELLNDLFVFDLVSICEGHWHMEHPYDASPHINLKMKQCYLSQALVKWNQCKGIIEETVNRMSNNTYMFIHARLALDYSSPDVSFQNEGFLMEFECSRRRTKDLPETWFANWFGFLVVGIEEMDKLLQNCLNNERKFLHHNKPGINGLGK